MRRYLGNNWLSVRETAAMLKLSPEAVELMARRSGLSCCWLRDASNRRPGYSEPRPFFSLAQVKQLSDRFDLLEAAGLECWEKEL